MGKALIVAVVVILGVIAWRSQEQGPQPMAWDQARIRSLTADLINAGNQPAPAQTLVGAKHVLIYFSANWCPPCRAFTPELVSYYRAHGGGKEFQVLFVSRDEDAEAMQAYMTADDMPWWGVRYGSASASDLLNAYAGRGIPCLVLLDGRGRVLSHSYVDGRYVGPQAVLAALDARR